MSLTFEELESVTNDYFLLENGKAVDIYFNTSFMLNYLLKQKMGIWRTITGGIKIRVPLEYDGQEAAFYSRGDTVNSDDRESVNAAFFLMKHAYGNATIYRIDTLENDDIYAMVDLVEQRVGGAQKSLTKLLANSFYDDAGGSTDRLTGFLACCNETASTAYADIAEDDLVSDDGTKPWEGKRDTTTAKANLDTIRELATDSKLRDGAFGKINLVATTEALFNNINAILQVQQRFTQTAGSVNAGFTGVVFEGKDIFVDDYVPSGFMMGMNTKHIGFAVHKRGNFTRTPWRLIPDSPEDRTLKIYFDGNMVVNNRKAHKARGGLT